MGQSAFSVTGQSEPLAPHPSALLRRSLCGFFAICALLARVELAAAADELGSNVEPSPDALQSARTHELAWANAQNRPAPKQVGADPNGFAMRAFGIRGATALGREPNDVGTSFGIAEYADAILQIDNWSARYRDHIQFGYDGRDIAYRLSMTASLGAYLPLVGQSGPVLRALLHAELSQLRGLNLGQLALPGVEFGYSLPKGRLQAEVTGILAPTLLGELRHDRQYNLSTLSWGAAVTLRWRAISATFDTWITEVPDNERMVRAETRLCGLLLSQPLRPNKSSRGVHAPSFTGPFARAYKAAICADFMVVGVATTSSLDDLSTSKSTVGLSLLVGNISRLDSMTQGEL
jgi:hypothetical protein